MGNYIDYTKQAAIRDLDRKAKTKRLKDTLNECVGKLESLKIELLFSDEIDESLGNEADQYYMLAISSMESAISFLKLASLKVKERD